MRRLGTISTLSFVGVVSALLAGCPVWTGDGGPTPDGGPVDVVSNPDVVDRDAADVTPPPDVARDTGPTTCNTSSDCAANQYCDTANHRCVTTQTCSANAPCPNGSYCDARGVCEPGCNADPDCTYLSSDLVCDTSTHQCVRGGACSATNPCPSGSYCVDGACRASDTVCTFNYQCGGRICVNGRCVDECSTAANCAAGQECVGGYCQNPTSGTCNCAANQVCVNGLCSNACTLDSNCPAGDFCDHGTCRVDDRRPAPFCTPSSGCASGSVCIDGVCRLKCPTPQANETADEACQRVAVNFTTCDEAASPPICKDPNELAPQCTPDNPCTTAGQNCVDGRCH